MDKKERMGLKKIREIEIPIKMESFQTASEFIESRLKKNHISSEIISETLLLFEALFHKLVEQFSGQETMLTLKTQKTFGEINIKLGFEGAAFRPLEQKKDEISPEVRIIEAYKDKCSHRYSSGYNSVRITVKRSYRGTVMYCFIGMLLAILVYLLICTGTSSEARFAFEGNYVYPLVKLFSNAMLMIGAPLTLFSMIRNLTEIYIVSERSSSGRKLQAKTLITSCISILLAIGMSFFAALLLSRHAGFLEGGELAESRTFADLISSLVPSSIFEPFETFLPFPMIFIALLITYAFCSVGGSFEILKKAFDALYTLFSKMLHVIMFALPFFCFLAILTPLLTDGLQDLLIIAEVVGMVFVTLIALFLFYLIRLLINGVKIGPFIKNLIPLIRENLKINSAIDAAPFNIRYCARVFGFDRKRISEKIPILAQTNLDGNCFLIMMIAMLFILYLGLHASWFHIAVIAVLVLFLSFGAPNQPGSILIGTLIILYYLNAVDYLAVAVYLEVFFGAIQNCINVIGDIVIVAIEEQKEKAV